MYWSLSTGLQVRRVTDVEGGEACQEYTFVVHVDGVGRGSEQAGDLRWAPQAQLESEESEMNGQGVNE